MLGGVLGRAIWPAFFPEFEKRGDDDGTHGIEAARSCGVPNWRIMVRHLLPNAMSPIIVAATFRVATSIITESGLSYLGFGVQPPTPTWGNMLKNAQDQMTRAPWTAIFPGLMIFIAVIAINFVGDGLRDALDPYKAET